MPHQNMNLMEQSPVVTGSGYHKKSKKKSSLSSQGNKQNSHSMCQFHSKPHVAFCIIHNELVCEECCDMSHHRDHNNQILLLKAAAQNFIQNVDKKLDQMVHNRMMIANCEKFNLRQTIRHTIIDFFDELRTQLDEL